ncbi:hypothetical protein P7H22_26025 [Paenibacillus larvae]|nr:hypothetical protein [Paenibacillus larvae]MDT2243093.1 hypothetical protein [Paenibacillus larvae]
MNKEMAILKNPREPRIPARNEEDKKAREKTCLRQQDIRTIKPI